MVTSPIHDGVEGTDCGEVWISTFEDVILVLMPPYLEVLTCFFPSNEAHFSALCHLIYNLVAHPVGPTAANCRSLLARLAQTRSVFLLGPRAGASCRLLTPNCPRTRLI